MHVSRADSLHIPPQFASSNMASFHIHPYLTTNLTKNSPLTTHKKMIPPPPCIVTQPLGVRGGGGGVIGAVRSLTH